ncbi:hypothetical protein GP486_004177, partial [Trichoglossum hirsutum]
ATSGPAATSPIPSFPAVDIVMTHGPPHGRLDETSRDLCVGCPHLLRAVSRARPRLHCFGHIHEAWGAERVRWEEPEEEEEKELPSAAQAGGEWKIKSVTLCDVDEQDVLRERAAYVDVGKESACPLEWGRETLFVNASIMSRRYRPEQAPWRVDLELPFVGVEPEGEVEE